MAETDGKNWAPRQKLIKHVLSSKVKSLNTCARTCPEAVLSTSFLRMSEDTSRSFWCDVVACPSFTAMVFQCGGVVFSAQVSTDFRRHVFWCDFVVCPSFTAMVSKCGGDAGFSSRSFYGFLKGEFYFFCAISWLVCPSPPWCFNVTV